jgi:hypothetical protein
MNVGELRKKLEGIDPKTYILIARQTDEGTNFFAVGDVSLATGTPSRDERTRQPRFKLDRNGPATWLFIDAEEEG